MKNIYYNHLIKFFAIASITLLLSACSHKMTEASAAKQTSTTQLPKYKAPLLSHLENTDGKLEGNSAFYSLNKPTDAFAARLFLIDNATTSLDVQYYIYEADTIGQVFSGHLLMAAHRGVKVRILVDDLGTSGKDEQWQKLASHPNIELRLFNPNRLRTSFRNLALLFNVNSLGKRMHNKSLIADGSAAIIGGRNIGDDYFPSSAKTLFLDYDILAIGEVVPKIYKAFDLYWNSKESELSEDILDYKDKKFSLNNTNDIQKALSEYAKTPSGKAILNSEFNQKITNDNLKLTVAKQADFYYDHPSKVSTDENDNRTHISSQISKDLSGVKKDLIIISPYFVPSEELLQKFKSVIDQGANITVITNSLASSDVFAVYAGYQNDIQELTEMGVKLYELKPDSFKKFLSQEEWANPNSISLHTKMMIADHDKLGVGSANIDPRSDKLNTEIFMVVSSEKLVKDERDVLTQVLNAKNLYVVSWGEYPKLFEDDMTQYGPIWHTVEEGEEKIYYAPPHVGFWKRFATDILSLFPIKGYL
jgi:putative cardiolipin synthase